MDLDDIPDLEDCSDDFNKNKPNIIVQETKIDKSCGDTTGNVLNEDTRKAFKKALTKVKKSKEPAKCPIILERDIGESEDKEDNNYPNWVTGELLDRINSSPEVSAWLQNPQNVALVNQLQSNPTALIGCLKSNESGAGVRKLLEILGEHFEKLVQEQEKKESQSNESRKPLIEEVLSPEEKELQSTAERILADEQVKKALLDDNVRNIIDTLRSDPEKGQMLARTAPREVQEKLTLLIQKGVLAVQ